MSYSLGITKWNEQYTNCQQSVDQIIPDFQRVAPAFYQKLNLAKNWSCEKGTTSIPFGSHNFLSDRLPSDAFSIGLNYLAKGAGMGKVCGNIASVTVNIVTWDETD